MPCVCFGENMSEQQDGLSPAELDNVLGPDDQVLGGLVDELMAAQKEESAAKKKKDAAKAKIIIEMDKVGMQSCTIRNRKLSFSTTTYYGIHHEDPEKRERFKAWMERIAPTINLPATDKVKKALEIWQDENPGEPNPDFIKVTEKRKLLNSKA